MACQLEGEVAPGATADEFAVRVVQAVTGGRPTTTMRLDTDALLTASGAPQGHGAGVGGGRTEDPFGW
jgi:hypothetical protein